MLDLVQLSKTVAHALRHEPWIYELELDEDGWTSLETLLAALRAERPDWSTLVQADLARMIATSAKRRYEIRGDQIRALYGHSVPGRLRKTPAVPPATLYHGTSPRAVASIKSAGLLPMGRQYVHLSGDVPTALEVGRRKARPPVVLEVEAARAHAAGVLFYAGNEKVWLADRVPSEFIRARK